MGKKKIIRMIILLFVVCLFSAAINFKVSAASEDEVITQGVYIDSIHIGGMTADEAQEAVDIYADDLKSKKITVNIDDNTETVTLADLGYDYAENNYIEEALLIGKTGNLIKRYKELKDAEETNLVYRLEFKVSDDKIKKFVEEKCSFYDIPAVNATIKRENGKFVYTDHSAGRKVKAEETAAAIKAAVLEGWNQQEITLNATVVDDEPKYTREMVEKCDTVLGAFSTTYTTSSEDRAGNLANGARLIDNTVLYPGDVFSAYEKLTPFTSENGYYEAGAYSNGKVVDSIGGGACQVTTTLYNAVLLSELEVVERAAHSMTISYVDLSRDAAIAGTWKDLKFKNDTESPIVIEAYTSGRTITFNIWGDETRDTGKRTIKFETVILDETAPGADVVTKDSAKPTTYQVTTQSAHTGYVAELYKIVYENGVEVSRTRVNKSAYNASPRYVTVGTMEVKEEEPEEEVPPSDDVPTKEDDSNNENTQEDTQKEESAEGNKPSDDNADDNETEDNTADAGQDD